MSSAEEYPDEAFAPQVNIGTDPMEDAGIQVSQVPEVMQ